MSYRRKSYAWVAGASLLAICTAVPAAAQDTGESPPGGGQNANEEIIVTAQFREQNL